MTVVAGLVHRGRVYIGGDSAGSSGTDLVVRKDPKVFRNGEYLFGFCGSFRAGQVLAHRFQPPEPPTGGALARFMVVEFIDALRSCFKEAGVARVYSGQESGGCFLVAVRGRLYEVDSDYQVGEAHDGFSAIGCGAAYALGALHATRGGKPEARLVAALEAAERHSGGVRGPFITMSTEGGE